MFAIAFDLTVKTTEETHPKGVTQARKDIGATLKRREFRKVQENFYVTENEDMANLFLAIQDLRALPWFVESVRDIRAFRIEQWSDFTPVVKGGK